MVRFSVDRAQSNITLPVSLSHRDSILDCYLIFDTGASTTVISWEMADFIGILVDEPLEKIRIMTGSGFEYCPLYKLDSLTVGDYTARNFSVLCHDLPDRSRVEGLLGLNFVKVFEVTISYAKGYIEIG